MSTAKASEAFSARDIGLAVERADDGGIAIVTLARPRTHNTLTVDAMSALQTTFDEISRDRTIGCVILRAQGRSFCAGHDLKEMQAHRNDPDAGRTFFTALFAQCTRLMTAIAALPQPVIAEVQGTAVAAGCQLVASCDMAVASRAARFGVNGIDVGFFCSTPMVPLSRNIGAKKAMELLTTGRLMDADEALASGLVNAVAEPAALAATTRALAEAVAAKSHAVLALGKRAFHEQGEMGIDEAYTIASRAMVDNIMMEDAREGFAAFIDKRRPIWRNR